MAKSEVFVTTFAAARNYTDQWANLNFIIRMKKLIDDEESKKETEQISAGSSSTNNSTSSQSSAIPLDSGGVTTIQLPSNSSGSSNVSSNGSSSNSNQTRSIELNATGMEFEEATTNTEHNEPQSRQSTSNEAINIPIVTSTS